MEKSRLTNALLAMVVILLSVLVWMVYDMKQNIANDQKTVPGTPIVIARELLKETPRDITLITSTTYVVVRGDTLSCISPKNWKEIVRLNNIKNPDLIFPGQELKLPLGTKVYGGCAQKYVQSGEYCKIGADPVNPHRELSVLEREHRLENDVLVTMGTGSGKTVTCKLHADEIVVTEDFPAENGDIERVATWVRKCGNPIFSNLIIATIKPTQPVEYRVVPEEKIEVRPKKKSGLIILKTFEGATSSETSGGILHDSYGNVVHDDFGNPIKTETK